jgi:hypothetical protein
MQSRKLKLILAMALIMVSSCNEPETVVTNIVHSDGSVTRRIEMKNIENKFEIPDIQVPFDSTWAVRDSIEISEKGDTIWIKTAEKLFKSVDEINKDYLADSGANREISRRALFTKKFKWFHTQYRFAEKIDRKMSYGYPINQFLSQEELTYFYSPESVNNEKQNGPDSTKYKALEDTIKRKVDWWTSKNVVSEWIGEFTKLTDGKAGKDMTKESLKKREDEFVKLIKVNEDKFDSLWSNGILLREFIGEANSLKYKTEADTSIAIVINNLFVNFKDYSVRIAMPGKVIGTNGFIDKNEILNWPVKSDYFMTEPYEMWTESKVPNRWAWIVSGLFLVFVITGIIIRIIRKG